MSGDSPPSTVSEPNELISAASRAPMPLVLIGGGGHALVVAGIARERGLRLAGFLDDSDSPVAQTKGGLTRLGPLFPATGEAAAQPLVPPGSPVPPSSFAQSHAFHLAVGDLRLRRRLIDSLRTGALSAAHAAAVAACDLWRLHDDGVRFGCGAFLGRGAIVHAHATLGDHVIINTGAIVEHECEVGSNAHIAPGAVLGGRVRVGIDTLVGLGSRVLPGVSIGKRCTIGAGAVVVRDVPDGATVVGVPARDVLASAAGRMSE